MKKKKPREGAVGDVREVSACIDTLRSLHKGVSDLETPFAEIVNGWIRNNPDTPAADVERMVRSTYAEALIYAIGVLEGSPPRKKDEEFSIDECIYVLENIKNRHKYYADLMPLFSKEYCENLAKLDAAVIDRVISILKNRE